MLIKEIKIIKMETDNQNSISHLYTRSSCFSKAFYCW